MLGVFLQAWHHVDLPACGASVNSSVARHAALQKGNTYYVKQNDGHLHWTASFTSVQTVQMVVKYGVMGKAAVHSSLL